MPALLALIVAALLLPAAPALAAAPGNDAPAGATPLALGAAAAVTQPTTDATSGAEPGTAGAPAGCSEVARTIWFRVRGTGHAITVGTAGSDIATVVAVYATGAAPTDANRIACDDGQAGPATASVAATSRGATYLVQVGARLDGGCAADDCAPDGSVTVTADGTPRPANDDRAQAQILPTGLPVTVDTIGATTEAGEPTACGAAAFAGTVWFSWTAPGPGTPTFTASAAFAGAGRPSDTVLTVHRAADGAVLACNDDADATGASAVTLAGPVAAGETLLVQAGARGADAPGLGEGPLTVLAGLAAPDPGPAPGPTDADGDGWQPPFDCDDGTALVHPGLGDTPGDALDQDCAGGPADWALPGVSLTFQTVSRAGRVRISRLRLRGADGGEVVALRCKGKGCRRIRRATMTVRAAGLVRLEDRVRRLRLGAGATLTATVTEPGQAARVFTLKFRRASAALQRRCRRPDGPLVRCWD